jgi:hypothetical protein
MKHSSQELTFSAGLWLLEVVPRARRKRFCPCRRPDKRQSLVRIFVRTLSNFSKWVSHPRDGVRGGGSVGEVDVFGRQVDFGGVTQRRVVVFEGVDDSG